MTPRLARPCLQSLFSASVLLVSAIACAPARQIAEEAQSTVTTLTTPGGAPIAKTPYEDLVFLASDELRGRYTGSPGNERAAAYIAASFDAAGAEPVSGAADYYADVPLVSEAAVTAGSLRFGGSPLTVNGDFLPLTREAAELRAPSIYVAPERISTVAAEEVRGRVVITEAGQPDGPTDPRAWLMESRERQSSLAARGALALIEIYRSGVIPFKRMTAGINRDAMRIVEPGESDLPLIWMVPNDEVERFRKTPDAVAVEVEISLPGAKRKLLTSRNVVAVLPGTDPTLAGEFIAVSAHFDHLDVRAVPGSTDSIHNGARDNGMGTAALLEVARRWREAPGKRPLLLLAWTAEEVGLLGSRYWSQHPTVPISQVAFNLNLDGAGYDDTTGVVFNGYGFTRAQSLLDASITSAGLTPMPDPIPQYGLFRQSDNYSMARAGVPAVNMAPGFSGFSEELMQYYHQPADHAEAVSPTYLQKYADAALAAARALSDAGDVLSWNTDHPDLAEYVELRE